MRHDVSFVVSANCKEVAMGNFKMTLVGALIACTWLAGSAQAAPVGFPDETGGAADRLSIVRLAHMWEGQDYCWYDNGWNGAGWYVCGSEKRRGSGWGGPDGWNSWGTMMGNHQMGMSGHHHMMGW
jgi:hypothetical protein